MYLVTVFDNRSCKETPVAPVQIAVPANRLSECVIGNVDENHYLVIAHVPSFGEDYVNED